MADSEVKKLTAELQFWWDLLGFDRIACELTDLLRRTHRIERAGDNLGSARPIHVIGRLRFEQFRVREDDPQLVVQAMKEQTQIGAGFHGFLRLELLHGLRTRLLRLVPAALSLPHRRRSPILIVGIAPQRVDENPNRSAGRAHVFNLAARQPVIDGPPADTDELARFHDRDGFAFHVIPSLPWNGIGGKS